MAEKDHGRPVEALGLLPDATSPVRHGPAPKPASSALAGPYSNRQFSSVRKAKEALREKALDLLEEFRQTIIEARAAGKYEEALKAYQWLLDHIPAEEGERMLEASVDKVQHQDSGPRGPVINIGFKLGGIAPKQIEDKIIEAEKVDDRS